jgi:hypothetical protein
MVSDKYEVKYSEFLEDITAVYFSLVKTMKPKNDTQEYCDKVAKILSMMPESDKNTWILGQAGEVSPDKRQEFMDELWKITADRREAEQERRNYPDLQEFWNEIQEEIESLSHEPYIDDQVQIGEIWELSDRAVKYLKKTEEPWELRFGILSDIADNGYYDNYGSYDPMHDLMNALCTSDDEWLSLAEYMDRPDSCNRHDAALIFRDHGQIGKYITYLEQHPGRDKKTYLELISYYHAEGNDEKAASFAWKGLEKCEEDQTDIILFLIRYAQSRGDDAEAEKLLNRGKRRRLVNTARMNAAYEDRQGLQKWESGEF